MAVTIVDTQTASGVPTSGISTASVSWQTNDVIVALCSTNNAFGTKAVTATGLTFGSAKVSQANGVGGTAYIYTAVAGSSSSSTVTWTTEGGSFGGLVAVVLRGVDTTALTSTNSAANTNSASMSASCTIPSGGDGYVLAAGFGGAGGTNGSPTTAATTEIADVPNAGTSDSWWVGRNTDTASTSATVACTWAANQDWGYVLMGFGAAAPTAIEEDITDTAWASESWATQKPGEVNGDESDSLAAQEDVEALRVGFGNPTYGATGGGNSAAATFTVPYPSGIISEDLLLLHCYTRSATGTAFSQPNGWSTIKASTTTASMGAYAAYYKVADGTETGSLTVTGSTGNNTQLGIMARVPGGSTQFVLGQETTGTTYTTSQTNAGVTPTENNSLVVWLAGFMDASADATNEYSGWTGGTNVSGWTGYSNTETTGTDATVGIAIGRQSTAAATGTLTVTKQNLTNDSGVSYSYAISPRKEGTLVNETAAATDSQTPQKSQGDQKSADESDTAWASETVQPFLAIRYGSSNDNTANATETVLPNKVGAIGLPTDTGYASETVNPNKAVTGPNTEIEEDLPTASDTVAPNKGLGFGLPTDTAWARDDHQTSVGGGPIAASLPTEQALATEQLGSSRQMLVSAGTELASALDTQDSSKLVGTVSATETDTAISTDTVLSGMAWGVGLGQGGGTVVTQVNEGNTTTNATWDVATPVSAAAGSIIVVVASGGSNNGSLRDLSMVTGVNTSISFTQQNSVAGTYSHAYGFYYVVGGTPITNETIRLTYATAMAGTSTRAVTVAVIEGQTASPIGAYPTKSSSSSSLDISVTPEAVGSFVYAAFGNDGSDASAPTANADSTILAEQHNGTFQDAFTARLTNPTQSTSPVAVGSTKTLQSLSAVALEIKASQGAVEVASASDTVSPTVSADLAKSASEQDDAAATETLDIARAMALGAATEAAVATDSEGLTRALQATPATDTAFANETLALARGLSLSLPTETASASETLAQNKALAQTETDTASATDTEGASKLVGEVLATETDSASASETISPNKALSALITDTAFASESVLPAKGLTATETDTAWASETLDLYKNVGVTAATETDTALASESLWPANSAGGTFGAYLGTGGTRLSSTTVGDNTSSATIQITVASAPAGSLVVLCASGAANAGALQAISQVSSGNLGSFSLAASRPGQYAQGYIYYAVVGGSPLTNEVVTVTYASALTGSATRAVSADVYSGQRASPIGATQTKESPSTTLDVTVTPNEVGSYIYAALGSDGQNGVAAVANAATTILRDQWNGTFQEALLARTTDPVSSLSPIAVGATKTGSSVTGVGVEILLTQPSESAVASDALDFAIASAYQRTVSETSRATDTVIPALFVAQILKDELATAVATDEVASLLRTQADLQESAIAADAWNISVTGDAPLLRDTVEVVSATDSQTAFKTSENQRFYVWNGQGWV